MRETKLVSILQTLTKKEVEKFESFLSSPLFNERKILFSLFQEIIKYYPDFTDAQFTKENIFKKLYPGKNYSDELLRNMA